MVMLVEPAARLWPRLYCALSDGRRSLQPSSQSPLMLTWCIGRQEPSRHTRAGARGQIGHLLPLPCRILGVPVLGEGAVGPAEAMEHVLEVRVQAAPAAGARAGPVRNARTKRAQGVSTFVYVCGGEGLPPVPGPAGPLHIGEGEVPRLDLVPVDSLRPAGAANATRSHHGRAQPACPPEAQHWDVAEGTRTFRRRYDSPSRANSAATQAILSGRRSMFIT